MIFCDGEISDGKSAMQVYGYDEGVRRKLLSFEESKSAVAISACEVKKARRGEDLEVLVGKKTGVFKSEKEYDVGESPKKKKAGMKICLGSLKDIDVYHRVSVEVKAICLEDVEEVSGGKRKQDVITGDDSGTVRLAIWEGEIGKLEAGKSYLLSGMCVREFRGQKFLSTCKEGTGIEVVDDVDEVADESDEESMYS